MAPERLIIAVLLGVTALAWFAEWLYSRKPRRPHLRPTPDERDWLKQYNRGQKASRHSNPGGPPP